MYKKSQVKKIFLEFSRICTVQHRNQFQDSNFPKSYLPQIRGSSWHNNKIKRIRSSYYSSNNFQDSNKRKKYWKENIELSPKSAFLWRLWARRRKWKSSNIERGIKIKKMYPNEFLRIPCDHALVHAVALCDSVNHRPVGNPKRKVWWVQQRVFPQ
jgi:hypothetical protein